MLRASAAGAAVVRPRSAAGYCRGEHVHDDPGSSSPYHHQQLLQAGQLGSRSSLMSSKQRSGSLIFHQSGSFILYCWPVVLAKLGTVTVLTALVALVCTSSRLLHHHPSSSMILQQQALPKRGFHVWPSHLAGLQHQGDDNWLHQHTDGSLVLAGNDHFLPASDSTGSNTPSYWLATPASKRLSPPSSHEQHESTHHPDQTKAGLASELQSLRMQSAITKWLITGHPRELLLRPPAWAFPESKAKLLELLEYVHDTRPGFLPFVEPELSSTPAVDDDATWLVGDATSKSRRLTDFARIETHNTLCFDALLAVGGPYFCVFPRFCTGADFEACQMAAYAQQQANTETPRNTSNT